MRFKHYTYFAILLLLLAIFIGGWTSVWAASPLGPADIQNCNDCQQSEGINPDVDGSGDVSVLDMLAIVRNMGGAYDSKYDVNDDGYVDIDDLTIVRKCMFCDVEASPFS